MMSLPKALARAAGQLADPAILRVLAKSIVTTLAIFAVFGVALWFAVDRATATWLLPMMPADYGPGVTALVTTAILLVSGWLLFRIVALAVLQFFADEVVLAVERKYYPQAAASARQLPFREDLRNSLRGLGRALLFNALALPVALVLLFTAIGPAVVFLLVNAVLLGRELTEMVWLRHRTGSQDALPLGGPSRFLLGAAVTGLLAVPFANLLAPVVGAAAATHLVHSRKDRTSHA
ncbi:EI24 domain-containing protein [Erythrobacter sp. SDW2]|uniref:EI24 domain-containing protein n=1 Tax=Erythrobacter sp. SDW2 TaxID=2907154 RepID=UPI001F1706A2|nr:EI24 domain-containing protein [Erythrobacter sp. SDW2]UIP07258.1 EI24 domain-containing protein [Erythrobacter sp. SDW2]